MCGFIVGFEKVGMVADGDTQPFNTSHHLADNARIFCIQTIDQVVIVG